MAISASLKRFRKHFNLTQKKAAEILGITQASYAQYEQKEKPSTPSADSIIKLARAFDVSADYILGITEIPQSLNDSKIASEVESSNKALIKADNFKDFYFELKGKLAAQGIQI